jgi:hypothetical protein
LELRALDGERYGAPRVLRAGEIVASSALPGFACDVGFLFPS